MKEKPTDELNELLKDIWPKQIDSFLEQTKEYLIDDERPFYHYMKSVIRKKGMFLKDVYSFAGLSESYGSKLLTMEKHTDDRDVILRLCIAAHFSLLETNRALKLYGMNELYAKDPRDVCIIVAINNRRYDLSEIDELLKRKKYKELANEV